MSPVEPRMRVVRTGIAVVFAVVTLAALAIGVDLGYALVVGAGLGIFVGGSLGFMIAARLDQDRPAKRRA